VLPRELGDLARHRRGEEQRLTLRRKARHHSPELGSEAHVQHPVRLVEDQHLDVVESRGSGVEVIDQTSWRRDEDRPALTQGLALTFLRHTADDHRGAHPGLTAERIHRLRDLHRELPGGREHQRAGAGLSGEPLEHRQEVRRGLSGPGGGAPDDVGPGQRRRDGLALDGGGSGEPGRAHRTERGGGQTEGMEIGSRDLLCGHV
jgi:hypothetical protein